MRLEIDQIMANSSTTETADSRIPAVLIILFSLLITVAIKISMETGSKNRAGDDFCLILQENSSGLLVTTGCENIETAGHDRLISATNAPFLFARIPVNFADYELLATIKGVGPRLAQRIIAFRNSNGPIKDRESLEKIAGIGAGKAASLADHLSFATTF